MADEIKYVKTQLNERTATGYNILYPQTIAEQVITNDNAQFVTAADITKWNEMSAKGLFYAGEYSNGVTYPKNAIVLLEEKYYFCLVETTTAKPNVNWAEGQLADGNWQLLSYEAAFADKAAEASNALKLNNKSEEELRVAYAEEAGHAATADYANNAGKLNNKEEKDLRVAYAEEAGHAATADVAVKYTTKELTKEDGTVITVGGQEVEFADKFNEIDTKFEGLSQDGTTTKNPLTIVDENGNNLMDKDSFNGSEAVKATIKQSYRYDDIVGLMKEGVIDPALLPASIVGQLEYQGSWSAAVEGYTPAKGHYFIAGAEVSVNPDGSAATATYHVGDWAVYNGTSWDKIDNTDAVTMVNGQIGAVETYKGDYVDGKKYHKGDIAKKDGRYYVCVEDTEATSFNAAAWGLLGAQYKGVEGNPVVVDESKFEVKHAEIAVVNENAAQDITVGQGSEFSVPSIERDEYGHIKKVVSQKYVLDASGVDTVRPVKVNGTEILSSTEKSALDLVDGNSWINVTNENGSVKIAHKEAGFTTLPDLAVEANENLQAGQSFKVPSLVVDAAGHITGAELKEIKLGNASIAHNHFEIKTVDNVQTIGAYTGINDESALSGLGALKFYQGTVNPTATETLKLNAKFAATELYQGAHKVLDSSAKVYGGIKQDGSALEGTWNAANNRFELGDSGVHDSTEDPRVYSAVSVNQKGIVVAGGQIVEFGKAGQAAPSESLAVGGLFFRHMGEVAQA